MPTLRDHLNDNPPSSPLTSADVQAANLGSGWGSVLPPRASIIGRMEAAGITDAGTKTRAVLAALNAYANDKAEVAEMLDAWRAGESIEVGPTIAGHFLGVAQSLDAATQAAMLAVLRFEPVWTVESLGAEITKIEVEEALRQAEAARTDKLAGIVAAGEQVDPTDGAAVRAAVLTAVDAAYPASSGGEGGG